MLGNAGITRSDASDELLAALAGGMLVQIEFSTYHMADVVRTHDDIASR